MKRGTIAAKPCAHCDVQFHKKPNDSWAQWETRVYCSRACMAAGYVVPVWYPTQEEAQPTGEMVKIALRNSPHSAVVDACDEGASRDSWRLNRGGYVVRSARLGDARKTQLLHRVIMRAPGGRIVDHVNGDRLDCRRSNLRFATQRENSRNAHSTRNQKRGQFKGIYWDKSCQKWRAEIAGGQVRDDGTSKHVFLGHFSEASHAARAYDDAARRYFGEFAATNFPKAEYTPEPPGGGFVVVEVRA